MIEDGAKELQLLAGCYLEECVYPVESLVHSVLAASLSRANLKNLHKGKSHEPES
jgi:hypothetical protein